MKNISLLLPLFAGSLALTGCVEPTYAPRPTVYQPGGSYQEEPQYYSNEPSADVYYVDERPYSRQYGPLVYRDDRYYYNRGGNYVIYDRPVRISRPETRRVVVRDDRDYDRSPTTHVVVRDDRDRDRYDNDRRVVVRPPDRDGDRRPQTNVVVNKPAEERKRTTNPAVIQQVERDRQRPNPTNRSVPAAPPQQQNVAAQRRQAAIEKAREQAKDKKKQKKDKDDDTTQQN